MANFKDQVMWITGASSGIGEALAIAATAEGCKVVLSARRRDELERVAKLCQGAETLVLPLDLSKPEEFEPATAQVLAKFGRIDIMVHNGGLSNRSWVKDTHIDVHRRLMEVNYFGYVGLTKAVLPSMQARRSGQFVVVSSVMGKIGTPMRSAYAASKHALHGFFDCLRAEVAGDGIAVTIICPGYIQTNVSQNALTADGAKLGKASEDISNGLPPGEAAQQMLKAIGARVSETFIGKLGKERMALTLNRFLPSVLERVVRGAVPK